jgi:lambda repressor-like predicted transcriptional regulator
VLDGFALLRFTTGMPTAPAPVAWLPAAEGTRMGYQVDPDLIRDFMLRKGLTKAQLAREAGTSQGYLTDILTGRRQPREGTLKALADALDVLPRALLLRVLGAHSDAATRDGSAA